MALFHVDSSYISKGKTVGGASGFARYLAREEPDMASQFARDLDRDNGKDDLVAKGEAHLPAWAKDRHDFWLCADKFERANGVIGRHYQITLARELSPEARLDLADDIRTTFFDRFTHTWAIHNPPAQDGSGEQPHLHVLFSTRREDVEQARTPKEWFARAPIGAPKDQSWDKKGRLYDVRHGVAILSNAALEREGHAERVSHQSLQARGLDRPQAQYVRTEPERIAETRAYRQSLKDTGYPQLEQLANAAAWQQFRQRNNVYDLSRHAMVDMMRDRTWRMTTAQPARTNGSNRLSGPWNVRQPSSGPQHRSVCRSVHPSTP